MNNCSKYSRPQHRPLELPKPERVLQLLGLEPERLNKQGYWVLRCPVHKQGQEKHPSLNLHHLDGYFCCHACGIKGSNVIYFYGAVMGLPYVQAAKELLSRI